jgi:aerobic carbon-monoxide dehydrogenase small subunit
MKRYESLNEVLLSINHRSRATLVRPGDTLLRTLRETLGMTGTKMGCENGDCGACTVLIDGKPVKSCIKFTLDTIGHEITTIEGLQNEPIQQSFLDRYGFQCGFCTPGVILNAHALLTHVPDADAETVRIWMESNLCRCTGYEGIEEAILQIRDRAAPADADGNDG